MSGTRPVGLTLSPHEATGYLDPDNGAEVTLATTTGRIEWPVPEPVTGGTWWRVESPGYQTAGGRGILPLGGAELEREVSPGVFTHEPLALVPIAPPSLGQPTIQGRQFFVNGQPWPWAMMTGFCDYALLLRGQQGQLEDVLGQAREFGAKGRRILLEMHFITHFYPYEYGDDFYARLPELIALENRYGMVPEVVIYADEQIIKAGRTHWDRSTQALRGLANVTEHANEWTKNGGGAIDPMAFPRFVDGLIFSRGSDTAEAPIVQPPGNYATFRERRDQWKCIGRGYKADEACWDFGFDVPFVFNEPLGAAEVDQPGRRSNNPVVFEALAAQYKAVGAYSTFHCEAGLTSAPLGPRQMDCARAFYGVV